MHSVSLVHLWKPTFDFLLVLEHGNSPSRCIYRCQFKELPEPAALRLVTF